MNLYIIEGILVAIVAFALGYSFAKEHYDDSAILKQKEQRLAAKDGVIQELREKNDLLYQEKKDNLQALLLREIHRMQEQGLYQKYSPTQLTDLVLEKELYTDIYTVHDVLDAEHKMETIVKIALCAEKGYLDFYSNEELHGEELFRIAPDGSHIILSDEEAEKIACHDYSFILDTIDSDLL